MTYSIDNSITTLKIYENELCVRVLGIDVWCDVHDFYQQYWLLPLIIIAIMLIVTVVISAVRKVKQQS